jgi:FkbM family methyltransferase
MKKYYGQNLEDKIIDELFPAEIETVLDLGANGIELSNSYFFISRGASAVLVEPSPKAFKNLSDIYFDKYKNVSLFNVAIGAENGEVPFFESGEHLGNNDVALLSTIKEGELKRWEGTNNTFQLQPSDHQAFAP